MHKLSRRQVPGCLEELRNSQPPKTWSDISHEERSEIRTKLQEMQGEFCAYCERKVTEIPGHFERAGHIEHFRLRRDFPLMTFCWDNLFYSCSTQESCGKYKDEHARPIDWNLMIDPCVDNPEDYLTFTSMGEIVPRVGLDDLGRQRAIETIRVFNLNHHRVERQSLWNRFKWMVNNPQVVGSFHEIIQGQPFETSLHHMMGTRRF